MPGHPPDHHGHEGFDSAGAAERLEREGELSAGVVEEAIAVCAGLFGEAGVAVRRVIDLGCGPGVGTVLLAEAFPSASVLAVDGSPAMLDRAAARAARRGHADRIATRGADLDGDLAGLGRCDLAWAAMAVHHAGDEVAALRRIGSLVDPRGLVCLLERADPMSVRLADDLGRPGIWDRLAAARARWFEGVRDRTPGAGNPGAYPAMLAAAGLEPIVERTVVVTRAAPPDDATRLFVAGSLERTVGDLTGIATDDDLDALRSAAGRGHQAMITASRMLLVARPGADT